MYLFTQELQLQMLNTNIDHYFMDIHSLNLMALFFLKDLESNKSGYKTKARKTEMASILKYILKTFPPYSFHHRQIEISLQSILVF